MQYAYLLLRYRDRSRREMAERLGRKGFDEETAAAVINRLLELGFLDDRRFAEAVKRNTQATRQLGRRGMVQHLIIKGVDRDLAEEISGGEGEYAEAARALVERKLRSLRGKEPREIRQKLWQVLARHGFSSDVIREALPPQADADDNE
jgi:regulatory protein